MKRNINWLMKAGLLGILLFALNLLIHHSRYEPPYALDSQDLSWGESQLEKVLRDRPFMARYARKGDKVWDWTVRQFAGEWVEGGIEWDPRDMVPLWDCGFCAADGNGKARVLVSALSTLKNFHFGRPKKGPQLWYDLVFELCNAQVDRKRLEIDRLADEGKIGMEEYCFRRYLLEVVGTRQAVHQFFTRSWVPNCKRLSLDPWDEYMKKVGNVGIPVPTTRQFIEAYFNIDYSHPFERDLIQEDFCWHHELHKNQYETAVVPLLQKNHIPIPRPVSLPDLKKKLEAELPPGGL